jgi:hypothetical protein
MVVSEKAKTLNTFFVLLYAAYDVKPSVEARVTRRNRTDNGRWHYTGLKADFAIVLNMAENVCRLSTTVLGRSAARIVSGMEYGPQSNVDNRIC